MAGLDWRTVDLKEYAIQVAVEATSGAPILNHVYNVSSQMGGIGSVPIRRRFNLTGPEFRTQSYADQKARTELVFDSIETSVGLIEVTERIYKNIELEDGEVTAEGESLKDDVAKQQGSALARAAQSKVVAAFNTVAAVTLPSSLDSYSVDAFGPLILAQRAAWDEADIDTTQLRMILGSNVQAALAGEKLWNSNVAGFEGLDVSPIGLVASVLEIPVVRSGKGIGPNDVFLYHTDAVAFASRPVAAAETTNSTTNSDGNFTFRLARDYDTRHGTHLLVADFYGKAEVVAPEAIKHWTLRLTANSDNA